MTGPAVRAAELSADEVRQLFAHVARAVVASEDLLCEADRQIGDGDHGIGMRRGFAAVAERLPGLGDSAPGVVVEVGRTLLGEMGGASGVVFGLMFAGGAAAPDAELGLAAFARMQRAALDQIMTRGGARPGDKTMVDALAPAVAALEAAAAGDRGWSAALADAAEAAAAGSAGTKDQQARFGKARTLGERSLGFPDPGSITVSIIYRAMADWAAVRDGAAAPTTGTKENLT